MPRPDDHYPWCHERLCGAYLERAVKALRQHGRVFDEGLPPYVAPIHWNHINLTGAYTWRPTKRVEKGSFRSLRPMSRSNTKLG